MEVSRVRYLARTRGSILQGWREGCLPHRVRFRGYVPDVNLPPTHLVLAHVCSQQERLLHGWTYVRPAPCDGDLCGRCCNCERNKEMIVWQGRTLQLHRAVS